MNARPQLRGAGARRARTDRVGARDRAYPAETVTSATPSPGSSSRLSECAFCRIIAGDLAAHLVTEDDDCLAFLGLRPAAYGHTLVVPRKHVETLWDADTETAVAVMRSTQRVASLLRASLGPDGLTLRQNNGAASGQDVPHLHIHLVPRWHGDGPIGWPYPPAAPLDPPFTLVRSPRQPHVAVRPREPPKARRTRTRERWRR